MTCHRLIDAASNTHGRKQQLLLRQQVRGDVIGEDEHRELLIIRLRVWVLDLVEQRGDPVLLRPQQLDDVAGVRHTYR